MKKLTLLFAFCFIAGFLQAQKNTLQVKAYQRYSVSGVAPKEDQPASPVVREPEYYVYVITQQNTILQPQKIWIKKKLYQVDMQKINGTPVLSDNGINKDTLVASTTNAVWRIRITGRGKPGNKPGKALSKLITANDLVFCATDNTGRTYTKSVKHITQLESARRQ